MLCSRWDFFGPPILPWHLSCHGTWPGLSRRKWNSKNKWPIFGSRWPLFGPPWAVLGPLLASPASGLTPSTRRNPDPTRSRPIFDPKIFRDLQKFGVFLGPKLASYGLGTVIERSGSKFCPVLVPITSQSDFVVRFYDQFTIQKSRFLCITSLIFVLGIRTSIFLSKRILMNSVVLAPFSYSICM